MTGRVIGRRPGTRKCNSTVAHVAATAITGEFQCVNVRADVDCHSFRVSYEVTYGIQKCYVYGAHC